MAAAAALALGALPAPAAARAQFRAAPEFDLPGHHLLDVGAADVDGDGRLDLFTTNHKFSSALLLNEGGGHFSDGLASLGLSPSRGFPGLERMKAPDMSADGAYLFVRSPSGKGARSYVQIRTVGTAARGRLTFGSEKVDVQRRVGADVDESRSDAGQPVVTFDARAGAVIDIALRHVDLPIAVNFDEPDPADVFVGSDAVAATERSFLLTLRDRHGLAFADLGGDRGTDLFAASGGLGGGIKLPGYRGQVQDELLVGRGNSFSDESADSGLEKGDCRGREAASVDVDGDGLLDVFEGCEGAPPLIYRQVAPARFEPFPAPDSIATTFRWADTRGDARLELLAAERDGVHVYGFRADGPHPVDRVRADARKGKVTQFALSDFDADGDLDALAVAHTGNTVLENRRGHLHAVPPRRFGLPSRSVAASFVDYDNDGMVDLDLVPQGLYHRTGRSSFRPAHALEAHGAKAAVTTWFDADGDGLRDAVIATGPSAFSNDKTVRSFRNGTPGGHWLEVDLRGPAGNAQAIGARLRIRCGGHRQFGFVGQSDDSRYSQGHYRLYFGLGSCTTVREATVRWPDGSRDSFGPLRVDRVIRLTEG
ncbi:MAG: CRTAC1 family protein [Thermoleophilales bacterium]|nr:CRTAC1 family protein [Thermoleophilales bacterium]